MIKLPNQDTLAQLKDIDEKYCISIYCPSTAKNTYTNPNRIRMKNLLKEAAVKLERNGLSKLEIDSLLRPGFELLDGKEFLTHSPEGLVVFISPKMSYVFRMPNKLTPKAVYVDKKFILAPIESTIQNNKEYFILSLDHSDVKILKGDGYSIAELKTDIPSDFEKALNIDEYPNMLENHQVKSVDGTRTSRAYHGHYNVKEVDKKLLKTFFRKIDGYMNGFLHQRGSPPLLIGGVGYLHSLYREVNTYKNLLKSGITKNLKDMPKKNIIQKSEQILGKT